MGLDAIVFKSVQKLAAMKALDAAVMHVDEMTGEPYFESKSSAHLQREDIVAMEKRLGNSAHIAALRAEIGLALANHCSSMLLGSILYDGTHSGDVIRPEDLDALKQEIVALKNQARQRSHELSEFMSDMEELIAAAEQHCNPIVFV